MKVVVLPYLVSYLHVIVMMIDWWLSLIGQFVLTWEGLPRGSSWMLVVGSLSRYLVSSENRNKKITILMVSFKRHEHFSLS